MDFAISQADAPKIKITPARTDARPEDHVYQPDAPKMTHVETVEYAETKTVGNMNEEEFVKLLVKGLIEAKRLEPRSAKRRTEEPSSAAGKVMAALGDTAHGVVDIAEGVVRGCVDVVTFGQARRY